jgi:hypothetical protein
MSSYFNEAGEPLMTAAEARFEASLDEQAAYDRFANPEYDEYYDQQY